MEADDWKRCQANYVELVKNILVEEVKDHLFQVGILTDENMEEISLDRGITPQEAVRRLLKILRNRKGSFIPFCDALRPEFEFLVVKLERTNPAEVELPDEVDSDEAKLDMLQKQLYVQTKMMYDYVKKLESLEEKVKGDEEESSAMKERYQEIEKAMTVSGLTDVQAADLLLRAKQHNFHDYQSKDVPDYQPKKDYVLPSVNFTETVARTLGRDVVQYVSSRGENAPPIPNVYAARMRSLVKDIYVQHGKHFTTFLQTVFIDEINGFQTLEGIADEIFRDGENNWGRVIVLYAFGAWAAKDHSKQEGIAGSEIADAIGDFLGMYVAKNLGPWIEEQGGWDNFLKFGVKDEERSSNSVFWTGLILTALGIATVATVAATTR